MIKKLYNMSVNSKGVFVGCENKEKQKLLFSYGFICGCEVLLIAKNKIMVVVEVLDSTYSISKNLASEILIKVE